MEHVQLTFYCLLCCSQDGGFENTADHMGFLVPERLDGQVDRIHLQFPEGKREAIQGIQLLGVSLSLRCSGVV